MEIYTLYQTTNLLNGKVYVGVHKESAYPAIDSYLGSGIAITRAVEKYGSDNFKREFLAVFGCAEDAFDCEREYVTAEFIKERNNYNSCVGGKGGNLGIERDCTGENNPFYGKTHTAEARAKMGGPRGPDSDETRARKSAAKTGVKRSAEHIKRMSETLRGRNLSKEHIESIRSTLKKSGGPHKGKFGDKHPRSKPFTIDGVRYGSAGEASRLLGISKTTAQRWKKSRP